ncbi:MAG: hypothetical protein H8F28_07960 [Fibrella sp.]|nr:hypothetical protein [Armatimonadota bacterium]
MIPFSLISIVGCQTGTNPSATPNEEAQTYAEANKKILTDFGETIKRLGARPIPTFAADATKLQKRTVMAEELDDLTHAATDTLGKLYGLNPPPVMREVHRATRDFVVTYRAGNMVYVDAIRRGKRAEVKAARAKTEKDTAAAFVRLRAALQAALIREGKTPEEADAMTANVAL